MKKNAFHICIDRVLPLQHKIQGMEAALDANHRNHPKHLFKGGVLPSGISMYPMKMALLAGKQWPNKKKFRCAFLDGTGTQKDNVIKHAREWCDFANVTMDFTGSSKAEIRISFQADPGSWSAIGTDCLVTSYFKPSEPTMNFGWLTDDTDDIEYRRVVVHEFGHALGAIHEHSNPNNNPIKWNKQAVYKLFMGPPNNWSKEDIDHNIFEKYSMTQLNSTKFDRKSIMLYQFPASLMLNHKATPNNTKLSATDKKFIGQWYPK